MAKDDEKVKGTATVELTGRNCSVIVGCTHDGSTTGRATTRVRTLKEGILIMGTGMNSMRGVGKLFRRVRHRFKELSIFMGGTTSNMLHPTVRLRRSR